MKTIPKEFQKGGWHHELVSRIRDVALYKRWKDTSPAPHYEVVVIKVAKACELHGIQYEEQETYPGPHSFGKLGWTYPTLELAQTKYKELTKIVPKKIIKNKIPA